MPNTFYITTPIYYVNALPHIGNCYTTVVCDVLARYHRALGEDVFFLTGTDENATKVLEVARELGRDPMDFVDEMAAGFQRTWKSLGITYDRFIRTSEIDHINVVQSIFARLRDQGDIYKGVYEGYYCVPDETFWADAQVVKDEDGIARCPNAECGRPVTRVSEENYFFKLSAYGDRLMAYVEAHPDFMAPAFRKNEVLRFIEEGLRDVCVTRKAGGWGIPAPGDPDYVIYVWFDALINYLSGIGYLSDEANFSKWWPAQVQMMAKDIFVRFHCTFWPAMLMALDLPLPERLFGHGFWTADGEKISKSKGNAIDPYDLATELATQSGCHPDIAVDAIRYLLLREIQFGQDGDFRRQSLVTRFNTELANDLGNLLNRTLSLVGKFFDGVLPTPESDSADLAPVICEAHNSATTALNEMRLHDYPSALWTVIDAGNKYINNEAPWNLHKAGNLERCGTVLYNTLDAVRAVAIAACPMMPTAAQAIWEQLGLEGRVVDQPWESAGRAGLLPPGTTVKAGQPVFPRIDPNRKPAPAPAPAQPVEAKPVVEEELVTIDDFKRIHLKVARILTAEPIPKANKLLKMTIDIGEAEPRSLIAGIAEHYKPEELPGRSIIVIANLQPAVIRGVQSQGMLLAAEADGKVILLGPQGDLPPGASVR